MNGTQQNCTTSTYNENNTSLSINFFGDSLLMILNSSVNENHSFAKNSCESKAPKPSEDGYGYFTIILLTMMGLILVIGTVGNSVVCYVFGFRQRKQRSVPEMLFLYLGAIDLTSSVINPSLYIYWTITRYSRWDFGTIGCKILAPLAPISVTLSALIILIIAVDRYFVICGDFGRSYSRTRIHWAVILAAVFSICLYIPYIILLTVNEQVPCLVVNITNPVYAYSVLSALLLQDVGFIAVLSFTNFKSFSFLRRQRSTMMEQSSQARWAKSNKRVANILFAMSCIFCALVLPRDIIQIANIISWLSPPGFNNTETLKNINALCKVLQTANSCVNVFIYSKMHTKFRVHLKSICYLTFGRKRHLEEGLHATVVTMTDISPTTRLGLNATDRTPPGTPDLQRKQMKYKESLNGRDTPRQSWLKLGEKTTRIEFISDTKSVDYSHL